MEDNFDKIAARTSSLRMRSFLCNVQNGWYIETAPEEDGSCQGGEIDKIIRDQYGIPVCLRVPCNSKNGKRKYDYISVDRIDFYEPSGWFADDANSLETYKTFEELDAEFKAFGYTEYDEEEGCWRNPTTGEEACF